MRWEIKRRFEFDGQQFRIVKQYSYGYTYVAFCKGHVNMENLIGKIATIDIDHGKYKIIAAENKIMPTVEDKYIKRTYITLTKIGDTRQLRFYHQRNWRGFDGSELWNLDMTIVRYLIPRLKRFAKNIEGRRDAKDIYEMCEGFQMYLDNTSPFPPQKVTDTFRRAWNLFKKRFGGLWT